MNIRICTSKPQFALMLKLAEKMKKEGFDHVDVVENDHWPVDFSLRYCPSSIEQSALPRVLYALTPFNPPVEKGEVDQDVDIMVYLALPAGEDNLKVSIRSAESASNIATLSSVLTASGMQIHLADDAARTWHSGCNILFAEDESAFSAQLAAWGLIDHGLDAKAIKYTASGLDYPAIDTEDPSRSTLDPKQRFAIKVNIDDTALAAELKQQLEIAGFQNIRIHYKSDMLQTNKFRVKRSPLIDHISRHGDELMVILYHFLEDHGIDKARYPIKDKVKYITSGFDPVSTEINVDFPVRAALDGRIFPYSGNYKDRFEVVVYSEDESAAQPLVEALLQDGYLRTRYQHEIALNLKEFKIICPKKAFCMGEEISVITAFQKNMLPDGKQYPISMDTSKTEKRMNVFYPALGLMDENFTERLEDPSEFDVRIDSRHPEQWKDLLTELSDWGFSHCELHEQDRSTPGIRYGAAPLPLVKKISTLIADRWDIKTENKKAWGDSDKDIWIALPERVIEQPKSLSTQTEYLTDYPFIPYQQQQQVTQGVVPVTEINAERVRIGNILLPRNTDYLSKMVPSIDEFNGYCLDQRTAETLSHVASCVQLQEPCLLEGETSASKTSVIQFLAAMLGQPVVRINLNGQTDTGELIGRFVPNNSTENLPVATEDLQSSKEYLEDETILILDRAARESRVLNQVEIYQIMGNENILTQQWRWQDGLVPLAMKKGWWLLLDEINLAEPQILERLNSILEPYPSLVLTENDNSVIGRSGIPVHASFRIFSTMNPAEYSGRSVLSPAFRDRWRGYRFVPRASEQQYRQMLHFMISGEQPDVCIAGQNYCGMKHAAAYPQLTEMPGWQSLIQALAQFHTSLEAAVGQTDAGSVTLGSRRKERYVVTRRSLLSILSYLASPLTDRTDQSYRAVKEAITRYYLDRTVTEDDRAVVCTLLDAAGIGPNSWIIGQPEWIQCINQPKNKDLAALALQEAFRCTATETDAMLHAIPTEIDVAELPRESKERLKQQLFQSGVTASIFLPHRLNKINVDEDYAMISSICGIEEKDVKKILGEIPVRMDISSLTSDQVSKLNQVLLRLGVIRPTSHLSLLHAPTPEVRGELIRLLQDQPEMSAARATHIVDAIPVEIETSAMTQCSEMELISLLLQHNVIDRDILLLKKSPKLKIMAIKTVRQYMGIGLGDAKDIIDSIPCTLGVSELNAENREALQQKLTELGVL